MINSMQPSTGFESESLQADVMRFMAIIGFCLVAIFALVRNTDARPSVPSPEARVSPRAERVQPPVAAIELPEPTPEIVLTPVPEQSPVPITTTPAAVSAPPPVSSTPPPAAEERGLSLGFTSDADFLRLVGAGTIELFVMDGDATVNSILRFDAQHPPHGFDPSAAPGQFYELLPATIPETITNALARRLESSGTGAAPGVLTWGVTLPPTLERSIAQHRKQHSQGTLLIDRNAGIRHVPPG